jgi:hypothetical protein
MGGDEYCIFRSLGFVDDYGIADKSDSGHSKRIAVPNCNDLQTKSVRLTISGFSGSHYLQLILDRN